MSKKLKNMKWESVALEGFPISMSDKFDGFVGLEECTSYGLDKESKRPKKKKQEKKRKNSSLEPEGQEVPLKKSKPNQKAKETSLNTEALNQKPNQKTNKKIIKPKEVKLSNGFVVETCNSIAPSHTNETTIENKTPEINEPSKKNKKTKKKNKKNKNKEPNAQNKPVTEKKRTDNKNKQKKTKLGEENTQTSDLTPEDMLTWAEFKLQEPIVKALMELGFKKPTKIQQLSLPAAIHGRRDILGAAETGSGKTLAFGLPILSGILKLKEKAEAKGLDVYEIPYKKGPAKKKVVEEVIQKKNKNKKSKEVKAKESSEDGYSTGDEDDDALTVNKVQAKTRKFKKAEDYLEEIEVPLRKRTSDNNDSDDENYVHLSDMLDSDDLADNSGDDQSNDSDDQSDNDKDDQSDDDIDHSDEIGDDDESGVEESDGMDEVASEDEVEDLGNPNETGIGCVKVVDNIEIPRHVVTKTGKPLYALIITPTRELAIQISRHLMAAAKYTGIKVATIVGGMAAVKQERLLRGSPEIVVATPGRLWELINQGQPHLHQLDTVKFLAIDETDRMIERGHFDELTPLLERLNADEEHKASRQNFVFSATLTLVHDLPTHMKGKKVTKHGKILNRKVKKMTSEQKVNRLVEMLGMTEPKVVDITQQNLGTAETLTECRITCAMEHKDAYLLYILKRHPGRTIVFCNSIGSVKRLATLLTILQCHPLPLHASMPQRQRLKNLERFRDDPHGVLIATDVAARGLDIPLVDHVVQYQCPRTAENYVHRSGRTARADREGINVLMVEPSEAYLYSKLCLTLNKTSEVPTFPVASHLLAPLKDLVVVARELDALELKKRRQAQARGWREKAAREMDIIIDDDVVPMPESDPTIERALKSLRKKLDGMLSRPFFPRGFSFKYPTLNDPNALNMPEENALQVMKKAIESGELKKEKRKSKNAPLLKLGKGVHKNRKLKNK